MRWWDGSAWGPPTPAAQTAESRPAPMVPARGTAPALLPYARPGDNAKTLVILSHLGFVLGGFIMPLAVYLVDKTNPFVRHHATEALNFQLTVLLVAFVSMPLMLVFIGFFTLLAAVGGSVVFGIMGAVQASQGQWFRYPVSIRFLKP